MDSVENVGIVNNGLTLEDGQKEDDNDEDSQLPERRHQIETLMNQNKLSKG